MTKRYCEYMKHPWKGVDKITAFNKGWNSHGYFFFGYESIRQFPLVNTLGFVNPFASNNIRLPIRLIGDDSITYCLDDVIVFNDMISRLIVMKGNLVAGSFREITNSRGNRKNLRLISLIHCESKASYFSAFLLDLKHKLWMMKL